MCILWGAKTLTTNDILELRTGHGGSNSVTALTGFLYDKTIGRNDIIWANFDVLQSRFKFDNSCCIQFYVFLWAQLEKK